MADTKISALPSATTPLAGTEVLPVVQSGATKQVSVANLTAGRAVSASSLASTTVVKSSGNSIATNTTGFAMGYTAAGTAGTPAYDPGLLYASGLTGIYFGNEYAGNNRTTIAVRTTNSSGVLADVVLLSDTGVTLSAGNIIQGTAAKGINFTANTPASGMTSQLLNWYEEGTWTPTQGAGLTVVGAFSSTGRYTRIGRQVTVSGTVTGATSVAVTAAGIITTNLPFTVVTAGHGNATNAAVNASAAVICTTTNVTSASAIAATGTITFSATYFV